MYLCVCVCIYYVRFRARFRCDRSSYLFRLFYMLLLLSWATLTTAACLNMLYKHTHTYIYITKPYINHTHTHIHMHCLQTLAIGFRFLVCYQTPWSMVSNATRLHPVSMLYPAWLPSGGYNTNCCRSEALSTIENVSSDLIQKERERELHVYTPIYTHLYIYTTSDATRWEKLKKSASFEKDSLKTHSQLRLKEHQ